MVKKIRAFAKFLGAMHYKQEIQGEKLLVKVGLLEKRSELVRLVASVQKAVKEELEFLRDVLLIFRDGCNNQIDGLKVGIYPV